MGLTSMRHAGTTRIPIVGLRKAKNTVVTASGRAERCAGRYGGEEVRIEGGHAVGEPEARDYAGNDGCKCDGVFKGGTTVNRLWMSVDKEEAD